jgi:hypothetical protein
LLKVNELHAGASFGELALINEAPRLATIVCELDCDFAVLNKSDYKGILLEADRKKVFSFSFDLKYRFKKMFRNFLRTQDFKIFLEGFLIYCFMLLNQYIILIENLSINKVVYIFKKHIIR